MSPLIPSAEHSGGSIIDTMYRLSKVSVRAEFDRMLEGWGAKCYQDTVEFADPPRVLTEEMLRDYLARFMEQVVGGRRGIRSAEVRRCVPDWVEY